MDKLLFTSFLILFLTSTAAADTSISSVEPSVVKPGESFTVNVRITNDASEQQYYQELQLEEKQGFKVIEGLDLGGKELCRGCRAEDSLKIKAMEDTVSGRYQMEINPIQSSEGIGNSEEFQVTVDGSPNLFFTLENSTIKGENKGTMQLNVENIGTETSYQTEIQINAEGLKTTPSRIRLGEIKPGSSVIKTIDVEPGSNPRVGLHTVSLGLDYREGVSTISREKELSLDVEKDPQLSVSTLQIDDPVKGERNRVLVELENTGIGEIESIESTLECSNSSLAKSRNFVGSLEEGESVPTVYRLTPNGEKGNCILNVQYGEKEKTLNTEFEFNAENRNYRNLLLGVGTVAFLVMLGLVWRRRDRGE